MHDFAITESYTIFLDFPLVFDRNKAMDASGKHKAFNFMPVGWEADEMKWNELLLQVVLLSILHCIGKFQAPPNGREREAQGIQLHAWRSGNHF